MKFTNLQIRTWIREFVEETGQYKLSQVIPWCLQHFGYITKQIWGEIYFLRCEGVIEF